MSYIQDCLCYKYDVKKASGNNIINKYNNGK